MLAQQKGSFGQDGGMPIKVWPLREPVLIVERPAGRVGYRSAKPTTWGSSLASAHRPWYWRSPTNCFLTRRGGRGGCRGGAWSRGRDERGGGDLNCPCVVVERSWSSGGTLTVVPDGRGLRLCAAPHLVTPLCQTFLSLSPLFCAPVCVANTRDKHLFQTIVADHTNR